ncbi:hypothetical protein F4780DRAFT_612613 [Xylariomycetidae sp. FL0641]|nr:hypothetical protein F4780DRAFT_612613 [Xylariomycetidae sp. FL0641]
MSTKTLIIQMTQMGLWKGDIFTTGAKWASNNQIWTEASPQSRYLAGICRLNVSTPLLRTAAGTRRMTCGSRAWARLSTSCGRTSIPSTLRSIHIPSTAT